MEASLIDGGDREVRAARIEPKLKLRTEQAQSSTSSESLIVTARRVGAMADDDVAALLGCDLSGTKRAICTQLEQRLLRDGGAAQPPSAWSLRVAASEVTGAGEGVHLRGSCEAGTVLACYPGVIFLPDDLPVMHQLVLTGAHG